MSLLSKVISRLQPHAYTTLLAASLPILLILPIAKRILYCHDYSVHRELASSFAWPPHFLYHLTLTAFHLLVSDWLLAQGLLLLTNYAALGVALYAFLVRGVKKGPRLLTLSFMAVSLVFVYAIPALYPIDGHFYFGYTALNVYHNPTLLLLKLIVTLHLIWLFSWLSPGASKRSQISFITLGSLLTILTAIAKPSYLVTLLPAVFVMIASDKSAWRSAMLAIFLPGFAVLAWLFLATFGGSGGLSFAPLIVISHFTELWTILPKTILSLVFPLTMLLNFRREVLADRLSVLCWLMFLVGLAQGLLLAETGTREFDGNWMWSGQISAFALFAANIRLLIDRGHDSYGRRTATAWAAFHCHLVAGLAWYLLQYQASSRMYW